MRVPFPPLMPHLQVPPLQLIGEHFHHTGWCARHVGHSVDVICDTSAPPPHHRVGPMTPPLCTTTAPRRATCALIDTGHVRTPRHAHCTPAPAPLSGGKCRRHTSADNARTQITPNGAQVGVPWPHPHHTPQVRLSVRSQGHSCTLISQF